MTMETDVSTNRLGTYCVFCLTGHEQQVVGRLERMGFECMVAFAVRVVTKDGRERLERRKLFPGYVFFRAEGLDGHQVMEVQGLSHVIKLLRYEEGAYALSQQDLQFIAWLWQRGGALEVSRVYREGDRIRVIDGPLKDYEGQIVQVNLKRKSVAIQLTGKSLLGKVWCSVELVQGMDA